MPNFNKNKVKKEPMYINKTVRKMTDSEIMNNAETPSVVPSKGVDVDFRTMVNNERNPEKFLKKKLSFKSNNGNPYGG